MSGPTFDTMLYISRKRLKYQLSSRQLFYGLNFLSKCIKSASYATFTRHLVIADIARETSRHFCHIFAFRLTSRCFTTFLQKQQKKITVMRVLSNVSEICSIAINLKGHAVLLSVRLKMTMETIWATIQSMTMMLKMILVRLCHCILCF